MTMTRRLAIALLAGALVALPLGGCGVDGDASGSVDSGLIRVTATTNWHADLAERIGGDRAAVTGLMGPGVDPHLYEATAGDVETLSESDMAVWNGIDLEGKMEEVFDEISERVPVVTVGEAVPERDRIEVIPDEEWDPHIWFDPEAWKLAAGAVADAYREVDPGHAAEYDRRLRGFVAEIEETDAYIREQVERIPEPSRILVTSHDAFSYFARAYGFEVAPIQGKSTATEATTTDIERVAQTVADAGLDAVFIESSVPQQTIDAVLAAAAQRGKETRVGAELFGDALGRPGSPEGSWAGAVRHNADGIAEGLGG